MSRFFQGKTLICLLIIQLLCFSKIKAQNGRIEDAIKYILSKINFISNQEKMNFIYPKYSITYSNFNLLTPINNNQISISNDTEGNFIVNNLTIAVKYSNIINVDDSKSNLEETDNICEITVNGLIFTLNNERFSVSSEKSVFNLSYFSDNLKISKLKFFKDFNDKKIKPIYVNKEVDITDTLSENFGKIFIDNIKSLLEYKNLLTYDLKSILDLSVNETITLSDNLKSLQLNYIIITNYEMEESDKNININTDNKLTLYSLKISGIVHVDDGVFTSFTATLHKSRKIYLNYSNSNLIIEFSNKNKVFDVSVENGDYNDFEDIFNYNFMNYLREKSSEYYN